jgi:hypothetical protein
MYPGAIWQRTRQHTRQLDELTREAARRADKRGTTPSRNKADYSSNPTRVRKRREAAARGLLAAQQRLAVGQVMAYMKAEPGPVSTLVDDIFGSIGDLLISMERERECKRAKRST